MDGLLGLALSRISPLIGILWMLAPSVYLYQAVRGLIRRYRLIANPVPISATVTDVLLYNAADAPFESTVADLVLAYEVDGWTYMHRETKTDHLKMQYQAGSRIDLVYEMNDPANVMAAARRPWDDVVGPMVFSVLLFIFMGWLLLLIAGQF